MYIILILSLFVIYFLNSNLDTYAENFYLEQKEKKSFKILDHGHKFIPNLHEYESMVNIFSGIVLMPIFTNYKIFIEFMSIFIIILLLRAFMIWLTVLPKYKKCDIKSFSIMAGGCYDKLFSGHTASVLLATLLYMKYYKLSKHNVILINSINAFILLSTRGHYTNDIITAIFITLFIYNNIDLNKQYNKNIC